MYCPKCNAFNEDGEKLCGSCNLVFQDGVGSTVEDDLQVKSGSPFIIAIVIAMVLLILVIFLMPAINVTRDLSRRLICGTNLKELGTALTEYAGSNEDKLPDGNNWCSLLEDKAAVDPKRFSCPLSDADGCSYAMNISAAGRELNSLPDDMVLVFDSYSGCDQAGGAELLNTEYHGSGCFILFCGGHVEFVKIENFERLVWDVPEIEETLNKPKKVQEIIKPDASEMSDASD